MEFGAALKENVRGIGTGIAWTFARKQQELHWAQKNGGARLRWPRRKVV